MKLPAADPKSVKTIRGVIQDCGFFLGVAAVVYGAHAIYRPAGYIVAGLALVALTLVMG